jgi:Putative zinc binding domain
MDSTVRQFLTRESIVEANSGDLVLNETRPGPRCRFCDSRLRFTLVDLGMSPLCESYVTSKRLNRAEMA